MVICWKRLFCGIDCVMISICDAESEFNDGTNYRYHLRNHHKELEQLKSIWAWKAAAMKVTTKYKKHYTCHMPELFSDKVIDFPNDPWMWRSFVKNAFVDDGDIQLVTSRFDKNTYCTVLEAILCMVLVFLKTEHKISFRRL